MSKREEADLPVVIPQVVFGNDGEPLIAREMVVEPSPVPKVLTIFILVMVVSSVVYGVVQEQRRSEDAVQQQKVDEEADKRISELVADLQVQQLQAGIERNRLRELVLALLASQSEEERRQILEEFALEDATNPLPGPAASPPLRNGRMPTTDGAPASAEPEATERPAPAPRPTRTSAASQPRPLVPIQPSCLTVIYIGGNCL